MKFQFLPENFSRSENAHPFETRKIRHFEVERIFLENKKMLDQLIKKSPSIGNRLMGFFYRGVALCFPQRRRGTECVLRSIEITAIDHAHNPVPHQGHAKVHYQTDFQAGEHKTCP